MREINTLWSQGRNSKSSLSKRFLFFVLAWCLSHLAFAQDHTDADRIKAVSYMLGEHRSSCDSMDGNSAQTKVCLNFRFQDVDSILNVRFVQYLGEIKDDTLKQSIVAFQRAWVRNRGIESNLESEGYVGHYSSIHYLDQMIFVTQKRIEELEELIEHK